MAYVVPEHVKRERERRAAFFAECERELAETQAFVERMRRGGHAPPEPEAKS